MITVFLALLPLVLALRPIAQPDLWRVSSVSFLVCSLLVVVEIARRQFALRPEERAEIGFMNNGISWSLAGVSLVLLATNALGGWRMNFANL